MDTTEVTITTTETTSATAGSATTEATIMATPATEAGAMPAPAEVESSVATVTAEPTAPVTPTETTTTNTVTTNTITPPSSPTPSPTATTTTTTTTTTTNEPSAATTTATNTAEDTPATTTTTTTPEATATTADETTATATPACPATLLREWNSGDEDDDSSQIAPPVAPAVVLNETSDSSSNIQQNRYYPVASIVGDFVRTSLIEFRDHLHGSNTFYPTPTDTATAAAAGDDSQQQQQQQQQQQESLSMRSETPIVAPATAATATATATGPGFPTIREANISMHDDETLSTEFVLVNGDLVMLPASHVAEHEYYDEDDEEGHDYGDDEEYISQRQRRRRESAGNQDTRAIRNSCVPKSASSHNGKMASMRRGVKGLKKWIKKKKAIVGRKAFHRQTQEWKNHQNQQSLDSNNSQSTSREPSSRHLQPSDEELSTAVSSIRDLDSVATSTNASISTGAEATSSPGRLFFRKKRKKDKDRKARNAAGKKTSPSVASASAPASASTTSASACAPASAAAPLEPPTARIRPRAAAASASAASASAFAQISPPVEIATTIPTAALTAASLTPPPPPPAAASLSILEIEEEASISLDTAITLDAPPPPHHHYDRMASIAAEASFVGNADQLYLEAGVLPDSVAAEAYIEDRLDDYDKYDKKDGYPYLRSMVPRDADFKVDKLEAPCVDSMLRRAGEFAEDLEASNADSSLLVPRKIAKGKSDGSSVPLTDATVKDPLVHNDILKLHMVGAPTVGKSSLARALRQSTKKARKRTTLGVDVHSWEPLNEDNVKFTIWDVQGASDNSDPFAANFGAHPGTQSLFFTDRSLFILVWDLARNNTRTYRKQFSEDDSSDEDDDDSDNEATENMYVMEEANRACDRALQSDIEDRVLSWVDVIARRGSHSAILPVAVVPSDMSPEEAKRRCDIMQNLLMEHTEKKLPGDLVPPKVLSGAETVICVSLDTNMGMELLQETILAIATDKSHSVFDHVGTSVPPSAVQVLETTKRLKQDHKLVLIDHLMAELGDSYNGNNADPQAPLSVGDVMESLHFLASIGELLYFGGTDDVLNHYVILSRKWLVSALSCILRNDLKRELAETRRFMNMQCLYSDQQFPENHVTQTFCASNSTCPLLSSTDTRMLWQSMSFMREAADRSLSENSTTAFTMFSFLEHLLVHTGVFLPLDIDRFASPDNVYFVPSLLAKANTRDVWTYKSSESFMTTLSHSWLFRDGAQVGLMEHVTVALLRDLYEYSHVVAARPTQQASPARSRTFPFSQNSLTDFIETHNDSDAIGHIKIHQMMCWKSRLYIKIGSVFPEGGELRESFVEIFVAVADPASPHCVASDTMRSNMQRLIVSGKGQVGHHGRKLWKGGYGIVLDSIKASVADCTNVDRQVVCPECLAHAHPSSACTWSWDSVRAAAESGSSIVRCMRGHRVDSHLIGGMTKPQVPKAEAGGHSNVLPKKPVRELLPSVVVVGLWDADTKTVRNVGSGFVVDNKRGLVITAAHILFEMGEGRDFGARYFGLKNAKAVIGVIPHGDSDTAVFRYFAEIVADDIHSVDACVLKITSKLDNDVADDTLVGEQNAKSIAKDIQKEHLPSLKMIRHYELEETVRILGFNQGGEGLLEQGKHVNLSADFAKGYICKQFRLADDHSSTSSNDDSSTSSSGNGFSPREEIVVICPSIVGHSGGPCVNDEGKVVGILSRADPVDRQRCYLVPSSELKALLKKAKNSSRIGRLKMY